MPHRPPRKSRPTDTRAWQLLARTMHGQPCWYCGLPATTADHVIPTSKGGTDHPTNVVPACSSCNRRKGDSIL